MQHERFNKPTALQNKLAGLDQLPDEPAFDTAAVWDRLEHRMEHRPAFKRKYLWWAAACLLLLASSAAWLSYPPQNRLEVQQPAPSLLPPVVKSSDPVMPPVSSPTEQQVIRQRPLVANSTRKSSRQPAADKQGVPEEAQQPIAQVTPALPDPQLPAVALPVADKVAAVEKAPPQKLKVVHLNELGKPAQSNIPAPSGSLLANHTAAPAQREGRGSISFSRNTSDDFIKINISPTN